VNDDHAPDPNLANVAVSEQIRRRSSSMKCLGIIGLALVGWLSGACMAAAPPETLSLSDLVNRPDRWPESVTLQRDFQFTNGTVLHSGDKARVKQFDGAHVGLISGRVSFLVTPQDCGLLDAANQAWSALTPAQRAVDPDSLPDDDSLWPVRVALPNGISCGFGKLPPGTEVALLNVTKKGPLIAWPNSNNRITMDFGSTDVISRARQLVLIEPDKRPSRVAAALDAIMVDADGKPYHDEHLGDKKLFAFYFGAGWCPPCRAFSPDFVKFADEAMPRHPELAVVLLSDDHSPAELFAYMKEENMPFPAVQPKDLDQSSLLMSFTADTRLIPHLVVVDRFGKVLQSNADPQGNLTDGNEAIAALDKLLNTRPTAQ
jgi:thiol-disulfide isomerase/thioredoxin